MPKNPFKERILAFNRLRRAESAKASDMDVLIDAMSKLPKGQLKKLLTEDVLAILEKYGYQEGAQT